MPESAEDNPVEAFRKLIYECASTDRWMTAAGPLPSSTDFTILREGIADAIAWCLYLHARSPLKRYADNRQALLRVEKRAENIHTAVQELSHSLEQLFPWSQGLLFKHFNTATGTELSALLTKLEALGKLAQIAAEHAASLKDADRGGRERMAAFELLVHGLAVAYENAVRRPATVTFSHDRGRHEGPFIRLVSALLPEVDLIASVNGRPLKKPTTEYGRGQKIREVLREKRKAENPTAVGTKL